MKSLFRPEPMVAPDQPMNEPKSRADLTGQTNKDSYFPVSGPQAPGEGNTFPQSKGGRGYGGHDSKKGN